MHRGKKVSEPVPKICGTEIYSDSLTDLANAWDTVGKVRSELRNIEHRLGDVERAPPDGDRLNQTGETSLTEYSLATTNGGINQTFSIPVTGRQFPSGATLDSHGWSKHHSKLHTIGSRKVSRLDDKYVEPKTMHQGRSVATTEVGSNGGRLQTQLPNRDPGPLRNESSSSLKKVDFNNQLELRKIHADGTYTDSFTLDGGQRPGGYVNSNAVPGYSANDRFLSREPHSNSQSTLTDSRAIRETDIRFLNTHDYASSRTCQRPDPYDVRWNKVSSRLSHVDVKVPSAANYKSTRQSVVGGPPTRTDGQTDILSQCAKGNNCDVNPDGYSSAASDGSENNKKRIKKHFKDFDKDTGALAKLKEKIRQQRLATSPVADLHARGGNHVEPDHPPPPPVSHRLHGNHDPVEVMTPGLAWEADRQPVSVSLPRKVAAGPPAPVYRGFNEAESRYKLVKPAEGSRKTAKKKAPGISIQEKRREDTDFVSEQRTTEEKPRKRVIAVKEKANPKPKEVITTSSWRTGQQIVLQALGPAKSSRSSKPPGAKESGNNDCSDKESSKSANRPEPVGGAELTAPTVTNVLSDEARQVLNDLHIEEDDGGSKADPKKDGVTDKPKKPAVKRKAPKAQEPEKHQPVSKSRHYDADTVRQYILKKKEERLRRKREEHTARQKAEEEKRKHLEDLYKKQKPSRNHKHPSDTKPCASSKLDPTAKRVAAWEEKPLRLPQGAESDKENREELDLSDGSSTITNDDSVGDSTPVPTPRGDNHHRTDAQMIKPTKLAYGAEPMEVDTLGWSTKHRGVTFGENSRPPLAAPPPVADMGLLSGQYRTRAERIQAIKNTAATLQNRLQAEAQRLGDSDRQGMSLPPQTMVPTVASSRWASAGGATRPSASENPRLTRHERIAGAQDDFTVFTSNLPGVHSLSGHQQNVDQMRSQDAAATRIQAAYRGQAVRQTLDWKLPSGKTLSSKIRTAGSKVRKKAYEEDDSSTFSDITVTDDSDAESVSALPRKIGAGLSGRDYHPGDRYRQEVLEQARGNETSLPNSKYGGSEVNWDKPEADPYSTLNVFTRHYNDYQHADRDRRKDAGVTQTSAPQRRTTTTHVLGESSRPSGRTGAVTLGSVPDTLVRQSPEGVQSVTPDKQSRDTKTAITRNDEDMVEARKVRDVINTEPLSGVNSEDVRSRLVSASFHPMVESNPDDKEEDVTIEGDNSYTESFTSGSEILPSNQSHKSESAVKDKVTADVTRGYSPHLNDSIVSDISSVVDEDMPGSFHSKVSGGVGSLGEPATAHPPRFSPNALERKMAAELNLLESMEESMRQLTGVERSRAVSMAQQETVSLAQMIKSRQQVHEMQMKELQFKARQESNEASQQLEEARKRAAEAAQNAVQMIAMVRGGETTQSLQESTRKLIESQEEAAKATAQAARYLAEARAGKSSVSLKSRENIQARQPSKVPLGSRGDDITEISQPRTARSVSKTQESQSYTRSSTGYDSVSKSSGNLRPKSRSTSSGRSVGSGDPVTANDSRDDHVTLSIQTASGAAAKDESKSESIAEDLSYAKGSGDDYSMNFDESMTEDEVEEKSFRMLLPSESHRRKAKHQRTQSDVSVTSEDMSVTGAKFSTDELSSLFIGEDSFNRFTTEMVHQYMKEEELRAQHQASLLKLREKALREKTKAELAWLDQQKKRMRNKGSDDAYPQIKKKQRGIIMKLEQEQAEIKRLQEANLAAAKERQLILKQQEELQKLRQSTQTTWDKVHGGRPTRTTQPLRPRRSEEIHTEDEVTAPMEDGSDAGEDLSRKDVKSDSEIYAEPKRSRKSESNAMTKLKNVHLDQRYLTAREKKLRDRRKNVEQLLAWKKKLDDEEDQIYQLEKEAIDLWDGSEENKQPGRPTVKKAVPAKHTGEVTPEKAPGKDSEEKALHDEDKSKQMHASESESSISEAISRSQMSRSEVSKSQVSKSETTRSKIPRSDVSKSLVQGSKVESKKAGGHLDRSESDASIQEDIQSQSSSNAEETATTPKQKLSKAAEVTPRDSTVHDTYGDDSFASNGTITPSSRKSPLKKLDVFSPPGLLFDPLRSPLSPVKFGHKRGSESESEDSLHAETTSDQSDVEGRIRALKDELHRRKLQVDRLKKEHAKKQKEKLKAREQSLRKQIEAYDNCIKGMQDQKAELEQEPVVAGKKPQIKRPRGGDHKQRSAQSESSPGKPPPSVQRSESESSRSSQSSSFEECRDSFDSTLNSPSTAEGSLASLAVRKDPKSSGKKGSLLGSISERSETPQSERARRSLMGKEDSSPLGKKTPSKKLFADDSDLAEPLPLDTHGKGLPPLSLKDDKVEKETNRLSARLEPLPGSAVSEILSARSDISVISEKVASQASIDSSESLGFKPLGKIVDREENASVDQTAVTREAADIKDTPLSAGEPQVVADEPSEAGEEDVLKSHRSDVSKYSYSSTKSEKSDLSYTEDFSETDTATSEQRKPKSVGKQDSLVSEEEISEDLSVGSDISEKTSSVPLLDVLGNQNREADVKLENTASAVLDEKKTSLLDSDQTPVQSPRDQSANLIEFTPSSPVDVQDAKLSPSPDKSEASVLELVPQQDEEESIATDSELDKVISSTAAAVEQFDSTPFSSPEHKAKTPTVSPSHAKKGLASEKLIDSITDGITELVLKDSMSAMGKIASKYSSSKKTPPPTLPKPKRDSPSPANQDVTGVSPGTSSPDSRLAPVPVSSPEAEMKTDSVMANMVNEAISDMMTIRSKQRERSLSPVKSSEQGSVSSGLESLTNGVHSSPEEGLLAIPRPGSPLPGDKPMLSQEDISKLDDDLMEIYGTEDEYHDDDEWFRGSPVPNKPPPPYPGTPDQNGQLPYELSRALQFEEPQYVVPHNKEDVRRIVGNAVDVFWTHRRYGESLEDVDPPETYFSLEDNGIDMDSTSRKAYKKLLFDLSREVILEIYKDEDAEEEIPPPWKKAKPKQQKYFKGVRPPTTVDVLTKLVQDTAVIILGLNGSQKVDPRLNKWGVRKKKDSVDNILVQELREDEPNWVNYDEDELDVKMHLTDTIFDSLLQDTVQTMNSIFRKRKSKNEEPG